MKPVAEVKTADEARDIAITWQQKASQQSMSYGEVVEAQGYFEVLAIKFGLIEEFKENGIL